jgi:hypothetical protein
MRKTARTVVWEGAGAQSPAPDPIGPEDVIICGNRRFRADRQIALAGVDKTPGSAARRKV